jgi:hypothetical protein
MAIDASGNILFAGLAYSSDLPGLWLTPVASRSSGTSPLNFVARLSPDGSTLSPVQLLASNTDLGGIAVRADGTAIFGSPLASVSLATVGRVAAIADSADNAKIVSAAPGQLLTLYGTNLAPGAGANPPGGFSTAFNGVTGGPMCVDDRHRRVRKLQRDIRLAEVGGRGPPGPWKRQIIRPGIRAEHQHHVAAQREPE